MKSRSILSLLCFLAAICCHETQAQFTRAEAKIAMQCYNNEFYNQYGTYGGSFKAMYYANTSRNSRQDFWRELEAIETLIDAYNINNDADFKNKIRHLYHGIRDSYGLTWANNIYNDDIIWGALMAIRAYAIFNDGAMKDMAINNFNIVWNRGWDTSVGGGIWWTTAKTSKNACVNAPAAICAMLIYYATGDTSYRTKAQMIMDWMKSRLYDANSGEVKGAINSSGVITEGSRTYTQGCFIGAASELQKYFPSENWIALAVKATDYAKNVMSNTQGLLPDEYCGSDDCPGFKSIFARWVCKFVKDQNRVSSYGACLDYNAKEAWRYRNSKGLMWAQWWHRTPDGFLTSWETTSGISMMNCVFLYRAGSNVLREATDRVVAESKEDAFQVYPTMTSALLSIDASPALEGSNFDIKSSDGRNVRTVKWIGEPIDVADLPKGTYVIRVSNGHAKMVKKFIKE